MVGLVSTLPGDVLIETVCRLARFERMTATRQWLKEEHGIDAKAAAIWRLDPTRIGTVLAEDLRNMFHAVRAEFIANVGAIPLSHTAYRLTLLQELIDKALDEGKKEGFVATLIEQGANEMGRIYAGAFKGAPPAAGPPDDRPIDELREELAHRVLQKLTGAQQTSH